MKEGFIVELLDAEAASVGYASDANPAYPTVIELIDDAAFFTDRAEARSVMSYFFNLGQYEAVLRKAVLAREVKIA